MWDFIEWNEEEQCYNHTFAPWHYCDIRNIDISDSVTSIGDNAFYKCDSLETINFLDTKEQWKDFGLVSSDRSGAKVTFGK